MTTATMSPEAVVDEVLREEEGVVGITMAREAMREAVVVVEMAAVTIRGITSRRTRTGRTRGMWVHMADRAEVATAVAAATTTAVARAVDRVKDRVKQARITTTAKTKRRSERGERPRSAS